MEDAKKAERKTERSFNEEKETAAKTSPLLSFAKRKEEGGGGGGGE